MKIDFAKIREMKLSTRIIIILIALVLILAFAARYAIRVRLNNIDEEYGLERWRENHAEDRINDNGLRYYYVNNEKRYVVSDYEFNEDEFDVKEIIHGGDGLLHMINYPRGYRIGFPEGVKFDFSA